MKFFSKIFIGKVKLTYIHIIGKFNELRLILLFGNGFKIRILTIINSKQD